MIEAFIRSLLLILLLIYLFIYLLSLSLFLFVFFFFSLSLSLFEAPRTPWRPGPLQRAAGARRGVRGPRPVSCLLSFTGVTWGRLGRVGVAGLVGFRNVDACGEFSMWTWILDA